MAMDSLQEKEIVIIASYYRPKWRLALYMLLGVCTGGFSLLVGVWSTTFRKWMTLEPTSTELAEFVYVEVGA